MKTLYYLFVLVLMCSLIACGGDDDNIASESHFFKCDLAGEKFERSGIWAYAVDGPTDMDFQVLGAGATTGEDTELTTVYIVFPKSLSTGTHDFENDVIYAYVVDFEGKSYSTNLASGTGSLIIDDISATDVKGKFSFMAYSFEDETISVSSTDGEFDVQLR